MSTCGRAPGAREQIHYLLPGGAALGVGPGADGDSAQAEPAEEQGGGVEAGDRPGKASDHADPAVLAEGVNDFRQELAADIIDGQVHPARREQGLEPPAPFRVFGIERGGRAKLFQAAALLRAA